MKTDELIEALRRLKVQTGSLACLGAGTSITAARAAVRSSVRRPTSCRRWQSFARGEGKNEILWQGTGYKPNVAINDAVHACCAASRVV